MNCCWLYVNTLNKKTWGTTSVWLIAEAVKSYVIQIRNKVLPFICSYVRFDFFYLNLKNFGNRSSYDLTTFVYKCLHMFTHKPNLYRMSNCRGCYFLNFHHSFFMTGTPLERTLSLRQNWVVALPGSTSYSSYVNLSSNSSSKEKKLKQIRTFSNVSDFFFKDQVGCLMLSMEILATNDQENLQWRIRYRISQCRYHKLKICLPINSFCDCFYSVCQILTSATFQHDR